MLTCSPVRQIAFAMDGEALSRCMAAYKQYNRSRFANVTSHREIKSGLPDRTAFLWSSFSNAFIPFHSLVLVLFVRRLRSFPILDAGSSYDIRSHPIAIGFTSILDGIGKATGSLIFAG
jgi:hypothetical protein